MFYPRCSVKGSRHEVVNCVWAIGFAEQQDEWTVSLVPRPSYPSVCHLQYQRGGRPAKPESHALTYLDMWRSSTFLLYSCKAAFWTRETSPRLYNVECSVVLLSVFVISSTLVLPGMCHSSTRPGTSLHVTQFYQAFPRVSTANDKHWGEKAWVRGYETVTLVLVSGFRRVGNKTFLT